MVKVCLGLGPDIEIWAADDDQAIDPRGDPACQLIETDVPGFVFGESQLQLPDEIALFIATSECYVQSVPRKGLPEIGHERSTAEELDQGRCDFLTHGKSGLRSYCTHIGQRTARTLQQAA